MQETHVSGTVSLYQRFTDSIYQTHQTGVLFASWQKSFHTDGNFVETERKSCRTAVLAAPPLAFANHL